MHKIVLKHSRIEINNYELGDCPRLEYIFSIWDPRTFKSYPKGIEYNQEAKQLRLPRGIGVEYIKNLFMAEPYVDRACDPYVNTDPIGIKYLGRDDRQIAIMKFILGIDEYAYTKSKSQLSCNSTTGSGKTFVTVAAMCYSGSRCIIITSSVKWLDQWKARILEYTPLNENQIYMLVGGGAINKILARDPLQYQFILASHSTIESYGTRNGWNKVEELFQYLKVGVKVFDEAHLYFDNMCKIDFHSNTHKTLYLTATPERSAKDENNIYQLYFKNVPSISLFDEESDPHVHYIAFHYSSHPTPVDVSNCRGKYGMDRNRYIQYIVQNDTFRKLAIILIDLALNSSGKILIYIGTNNAIKIVEKLICEVMPFMQPYIGIYTSITDPTVKDMMLRSKIILSTTKSCGSASDIPYLSAVINLAEPFRSPVLAKQSLGRCRDDNTVYLDVVDHGLYYTKKYYEEKKPVFFKYAKSCKDIHMSDDEINKRYNDICEKYNTKKVMCMRVFDK